MKNSQYSTYVKLFRLFLVLSMVVLPFVWFYPNNILFTISLGCYGVSGYFKTLYQDMGIKVLKEEVEKLKNV
ncbi:MAG: hypothetical protein KA007_02330 [Candidatus Pacebacteria bacterium]|nr:hypothetical protein [Candidatus Paceibacterota bacterium]